MNISLGIWNENVEGMVSEEHLIFYGLDWAGDALKIFSNFFLENCLANAE